MNRAREIMVERREREQAERRVNNAIASASFDRLGMAPATELFVVWIYWEYDESPSHIVGPFATEGLASAWCNANFPQPNSGIGGAIVQELAAP